VGSQRYGVDESIMATIESSIFTSERAVDVQFVVGACSSVGTSAVTPRSRTDGNRVTGSREKVVSWGSNLRVS
jgi:hypothetical protein